MHSDADTRRTRPPEPRTGHRAEARAQALAAAEKIVGAERVARSRGDGRDLLGPNIGHFRTRRVGGVIRPRAAAEVAELVTAFDARPGSGPLHVVSTGRNWGLGSQEPAADDAVVLLLGDLDEVRELDVAGGWAVIEPGVTQARMFELLAGTPRMLNVTVSAAATSVIGNLMDRGVGLRHQRTEDLLGLEVVLPDGTTIHAGWWPDGRRPTAPYPHGLGPSPLQLFPQSGLGVVTAAAVRLLPRPEALRVLTFQFERRALGTAVDELRSWVHQGMVRGVSRIYDPPAARPHGGTPDRFLMHVCVDGAAELVDAAAAAVAARAGRSGVLEPGPENPEITSLMERAYNGDPDLEDTLFEAKTGQSADRAAAHGAFLLFLPLVPFDGAAVAHAVGLLREIGEAAGVRCGSTAHVLGTDVVDLVVAIRFERTPESAAAAHEALGQLYERFAAAGFVPYRLDVDRAGHAERLRDDPAAAVLPRRIKSLLDPNGTLAAGRY